MPAGQGRGFGSVSAAGPMPEPLEPPRLFPGHVAHRGMRLWNAEQLPPEIALPKRLGHALRGRQIDYVSGRLCAREALAELGAEHMDVGLGADGSPIWPAGFLGSITHSGGQAFAAAASAAHVAGLGLDIEQVMPAGTARELTPMIAGNDEYRNLRRAIPDEALLTTIIFCAKEAAFKCLYPRVQFRFDFADVEIVTIDTGTGAFSVVPGDKVARALPGPVRLEGKIVALEDVVHAGLIWPR